MVSRRNFFSICIMMVVLLFMFQFLQVFKESGNTKDSNAHISDVKLSGSAKWGAENKEITEKELKKDGFETNGMILFLGKKDSPVGGIVGQWCDYTKRTFEATLQMPSKVSAGEKLPKLLLIDSQAVALDGAMNGITAMAKAGVPIVFCNLPSAAAVKDNKALQDILGVRKIEGEVETEGIHLFSGFLFGGEAIFKTQTEEDEDKQDMELSVPWYLLGKGTKVYMVGMLDEATIEREKFPPLLWRNSYEGTPVFAVNGDFLSGLEGLGILEAFEYEASPYTIYPVVNARNTLLTNYPGFTDENDAVIREMYSRGVTAVYRDIMWPGISALAKENNLKLHCFLFPRHDYDSGKEPKNTDVSFYLQQMREIDAEAGQSLVYCGNISLEEKLKEDKLFWDLLNYKYRFGAYYAGKEIDPEVDRVLAEGKLTDIRTLTCEYDSRYPLISYYTDEVTLQCITENARDFTYSCDLRQRGIETALGYSNVEIPLQNVTYPESPEDRWENYFEKVSSNMTTYYSDFKAFDATTLSESDARVRSFLNLDFAKKREEDTIFLKTAGRGEAAWFILRTHGETVAEIKGASYEKIEEDAYLLQVSEDIVEIKLGISEEQLKYYFPEDESSAPAWRN